EAALTGAALAAALCGVASTTTRLRGSALPPLPDFSTLADLSAASDFVALADACALPRPFALCAGASSPSSPRSARAAAAELGRSISTRLCPATSLLPESLFHDCTCRVET